MTAMIAPVRGLSDSVLDAIAALEQRVVGCDGGRLKLEWGRLRGRSGEQVEDVLAWDGDALIGFAGLYGPWPGSSSIEIAGMVGPGHRRRGVGTALLDAILEVSAGLGVAEPLVIVPRGSVGGRALVHARGARLEHSEHALVLDAAPVDGPGDPLITMRTAQSADVAALLRVLSSGFGFAPSDLADRLVESDRRTLVIERDGKIVGTIAVSLVGEDGGVFGFAVDPAWRGRGIGRDALRRACRDLFADGASQVGLEVAVENDRALHLYTSLGFTPVITEDYWTTPSSV